jgi:hypothetical protein
MKTTHTGNLLAALVCVLAFTSVIAHAADALPSWNDTAPKEYLDKMLAEPFKPFTFSPAGAAVYQLGPFGTAAKKLKEWDLKP